MSSYERTLLAKLVQATTKAIEVPQGKVPVPIDTAEAMEAEARRLNALRNPPRGR